MLDELESTRIANFNGLWSRGPGERVPEDHFLTARNIRYLPNGFETRYGTSLSLSVAGGVRRFFPYSIEGQSDRILYLDTAGRIYDSLYPASPILTIPGMTDFSMVVMNDRAYLSPHNGITGQAGQFVHVYVGAGNPARLAGANQPSGFTLVAQDSDASGYVEVGLHLYAVVFETESGFLSQPGPVIYAQHTSAGSFKTRISSIPIGPAGTVARHIVASQVIAEYDGNQDGIELFFIEGAALPNNTTTTIDVEFYDSQLVRSAEYLKSQMALIPAVLGFTTFAGSLVGWAPNTEPSSVYLSKAGEPESISLLNGGIEVDPSVGGGVKNCVAYRGGTLMIHKSNRVYSTANNGEEPAYWDVQGPIDMGVGSSVFGVAAILDEEGNTVDRYIVASKKGIIAYNGDFSNVITVKIEDLWARVTKTAFHTIQLALDPINEVLYAVVPLDGATTPNALLYCDYSNGFTVPDVRWAFWEFANYRPTAIGIDVDDDGEPLLKIASLDGNIYFLDETVVNDNLVAIPDPTFETGHIGDDKVMVHYFGGVRLRVTGTGILNLSFLGLDDAVTTFAPSMILSAAPGRFLQSEFSLQSQTGRLKGLTDAYGEKFRITQINIYHNPFWAEEPA
jgi:hypothetical protein